MSLPPSSSSSSGSYPVKQPFSGVVQTPPGGPSYVMTSILIKAGAVTGTVSVNPPAVNMPMVQSAVINNGNNSVAGNVTIGGFFSWRIDAHGFVVVPVYYNSGVLQISATIDTAQVADISIQIALFDVPQQPSGGGETSVTITQGNVNVTGDVTITAGTLDATITNASLPVTQSGAWSVSAVQSGAWSVSPLASPVGGATPFHLLSAASTNAANIKSSAGTVYSIMAVNTAAATYFLRLFDKASTPIPGTDVPVLTIPVLAGQSVTLPVPTGIACASGIGIDLTGAIGDNDATVAAPGVAIGLVWK